MIDFRYHVVSIVAVFLALALGLFIGSTSLRGAAAENIRGQLDSVANENQKLSGQLSEARSQLSHGRAFDNAVVPYAIRGRLAGQTVTLVSAPDVEGDVREQLVGALKEAGATVAGDVRVQPTLLDPEQDQFLTTLTDRLPVPGRIPQEGTGAERALALLADVLASRPQNTPIGTAAAGRVLAAYEDGDLISVNGDEPRTGSLVVVLSATPPATPDDADTSAVRLLTVLAADLDRAGVGAVVAGPTAAAADGGLLAAIRDDKTVRSDVSSVDGVELPAGLIATVIALAEQADGGAGSYGLTSDDPLPSPSPS